MPPGLELKGIRGNYAAYCALRIDDTIVCWGDEKTSHLSVPEGLELFVPPLAP